MGYDSIELLNDEINKPIVEILKQKGIIKSDILYSYEERKPLDYTIPIFIAKPDKNKQIFAEIILAYKTKKENDLLMYRVFSEFEAPVAAGCPEYILEVLSPTTEKLAQEWRRIAKIGNEIAKKLNITPDDKPRWESTWEFVHDILYNIKDKTYPTTSLDNYLSILQCFK